MESSDFKNYFIVGFIVILGFLLLFFGIRFLQGTVNGEKVSYSVIFPTVGALNSGDPVKISGILLGEVIRTELWQGQVKVTFSLKTNFTDKETGVVYPLNLPMDSKISIQNIGLMGEREINILLGTSSENLLPGSTLQNAGLFDSGIPEVMAEAGNLLSEANQILLVISQNTQTLFKNMNSTIHALDSTIQFLNQLQNPIKNISKNLEKMTSNFASISDSLNDPKFITHIKSFIEKSDSIVTQINHSKNISIDVDLF